MSIRVEANPDAVDLATRVKAENPGVEVAFMVDDGCCENSGLQLQQVWWKDPNNVEVGEIAGIPVYCPANIARILDGSLITVKVVSSDERVDSFSMETALGCRFSTRIRPEGAPTTATRA